ncbi:beta-N-acetylhexosaminidase [Acidovorax sp. GBBC 3334]|uniref:beta-N-acetylhexosaminidase n=1 Tax=Acidovorax sp. GBBC 3334 TaxID=2940496 RepID=UPI00230463EB|nr:beta-N-acetylhexosaminidase [Acidovorax sp. GBBC 3334]MDA8454593.1 beta-N-acetylhexosaminidase [Acidovorax sp. GBBC 3334]
MTADTDHAPVILDVAGTTLTAADRRRLAHPLTGGVILFARNWQDRAQLLELTASIKAVRDDLLICVDHEGGRVQRFRTDGFTPLPPMRALGRLWMQGDANQGPGSGAMRATDAATAVGYVLASELRSCGVDFSFAPVLDLDWQGEGEASVSRVIGDRAFHRDPRVVALLAKSVAHGMLQAGMAHCGKHFPGHGFVAADSHTDIPVDRRGLRAILRDDAAPYAWLSNTLAAVMPAHVIYPRVDVRPAGFSRRWLQEILRQRLRFGGAIFSDDLSMEAARRIDGTVVDYATASLAALDAGCDLVLVCNQSLVGEGAAQGRGLDELLEGLDQARVAGRWRPSVESEARRLALLPQTMPHPWDELMLEPAYLRALDTLP